MGAIVVQPWPVFVPVLLIGVLTIGTNLIADGLGRALIGIGSTWETVEVAELAAALQSMRLSRISLRQQAYQGLHDLVYAAYFSGKETWQVLGYPGPVDL